MATSNQVQTSIKRFNDKVDRAVDEITEITQVIKDLEKALSTFNADEDLEVTRGVKSEISKGKQQVEKLRKALEKLEKELGDTNRKFQNLAT